MESIKYKRYRRLNIYICLFLGIWLSSIGSIFIQLSNYVNLFPDPQALLSDIINLDILLT